MDKFVINYRRFDKTLPALYKKDERNAGWDLFARLDKPLVLWPGQVEYIPLNVATEIPPNAVGLLFQRSSTYNKWKVKLTNGVGVIDSSFCGDKDEWKAQFKNESDQAVVIKNGDKICQALFIPLLPVVLVEKDYLRNASRGGFGTSFDNASDLE